VKHILALLFLLVTMGTELFAETHGSPHGGGFPWEEIVKQAINFGILVAALVFFLRKPLSKFLKERRELLIQSMEEAKRANEEAKEKLAGVEEKLSAIEGEIGKINESMDKEIESEIGRIKDLTSGEIERIKEQASFAAEQELKIARQELRQEAADLSVETAKEIIARSVDSEDQKRFVRESVEKLKESDR